MKSCLKTPSLPGSPCPKHVAWGKDGSDEVHWADEWDRTPSVPAGKLSFQELLELEEITSSLPDANRPFDLRPPKQALSRVPIGLLPLNSADAAPKSPVSSATSPTSPVSTPSPFVMPPGRARPPPGPRLASPALTHLRPPTQPAPRPKTNFTFVPLLAPDSPTPTRGPSDAAYFPPYSPERAAADGEPDRVIAPRSKPMPIPSSNSAHAHSYGGYGYEAAYRAAEAAAYSPPFGSSMYDYKRDKRGMLGGDRAPPSSPQPVASGSVNRTEGKTKRRKKKTSVIVINDMEVEIEDGSETDDDDEPKKLATPITEGIARMGLPTSPTSPSIAKETRPWTLPSPPASPPHSPSNSPRVAARQLGPSSPRNTGRKAS